MKYFNPALATIIFTDTLQRIKKFVTINTMVNKMYFSKILSVFCGGALCLATTACDSVPTEIPKDLDAQQLIQLGQDKYDANKYKSAEAYFNEVLERYGSDTKHYVEATYELGHLYFKKKRYAEAYNCFTEILEIYENTLVGLPGAYKILCNIELEKIPEKEMKSLKAQKAKQEADLANEAKKAAAENERKERDAAQEKRRRIEEALKAQEEAVRKAAEELEISKTQQEEQSEQDKESDSNEENTSDQDSAFQNEE